MRKNTIATFVLLVALLFTITVSSYSQQAFDKNNLTVLVAADAEKNTTVSVVEINKSDANQSAVQTIDISGSGENAIRVSGYASSTLYASNSADGTLLCFTGHLSDATSGNVNKILDRAVIAVASDGTYVITTTYTGVSRQQTRCATTFDNVNFYIADQEGQYTNDAMEPSPSKNIRGIKIFGETVYVGQQSDKKTPVAITSAISDGFLTDLPGLDYDSVAQDFYFVSSGTNGEEYDILYVTSSLSDDKGTVDKYSLVNDSWNYNGSYVTNFGGFGLLAEKAGTGANLYVTTGAGGLADNRLVKLFDAAGYNTNININTTQNINLFTAPNGAVLKGVAFALKDLSSSISSPVIMDYKFRDNKLIFDRMPSSPVEVFAITGAKILTFEPSEMIDINLPKGIYIIRTSGLTAKIMVR